jgi:hypothetical protein
MNAKAADALRTTPLWRYKSDTENALYITSVVKNAPAPPLPPEKPHHPPRTSLYGPSSKKEKFQFAVGT